MSRLFTTYLLGFCVTITTTITTVCLKTFQEGFQNTVYIYIVRGWVCLAYFQEIKGCSQVIFPSGYVMLRLFCTLQEWEGGIKSSAQWAKNNYQAVKNSTTKKTSLKWLSDHKRSLACDFSLVWDFWLCSRQYFRLM